MYMKMRLGGLVSVIFTQLGFQQIKGDAALVVQPVCHHAIRAVKATRVFEGGYIRFYRQNIAPFRL